MFFLKLKFRYSYYFFLLLDEEPIQITNENADPKNNILHGKYKLQVI